MKKCKHGHKLTPKNLYVNPQTGARACRTCNRESSLASYYRKKHGLTVIPYRYKTGASSVIPFKKVHGTLIGIDRGRGFDKTTGLDPSRRVRTNKYKVAEFVNRGL